MRALLIYYTGTYNTRFLTDKVANVLKSTGFTVDRVEITSKTPPADTKGYELVGFGYPIYGFNAPHPFMKYLGGLEFLRGQKYFIYKNSGETFEVNNASSRKILRRMGRCGARFCGEYHFVMPYNIHFGFDEDFIRQIAVEDKKLLAVMKYNLEHGIAPEIKSNPVYNAAAFFVGIQAVGGAVNSFLYRVDKDKCTGCGLCAQNCPGGNIRLENGGVPKFGHRCDMCMRCSFFCPQKAVNIGFLQGWQVNRYYDLEGLWNCDGAPGQKPYITGDSRGFYRCFVKTFADIDERYDKITRAETSGGGVKPDAFDAIEAYEEDGASPQFAKG